MTILEGIAYVCIVFFAAGVAVFRTFYMRPEDDEEITPEQVRENHGIPAEEVAKEEDLPEPVDESKGLDFSTPQAAFHSTRVICDEMGLTYEEKNLICACIYQESRFLTNAKGENKDLKTGKVWSTDWGIVQVNDTKGWHIGPGLQFPSVEYVLTHPEECVRWMVKMYKTGLLRLWASYTSGAYKQWLLPSSPMWKLKR